MKRINYPVIILCLFMMLSCNRPWLDQYEYDEFTINNVKGIIVKPTSAATGKWIVRPAYIGAFPYVDDLLLKRGYMVGFYDVTHEYGNCIAQKNFKDYLNYCKLTYNLNEKVILEGFSRGGFFALCYAENHPDDVAKIYVDNPVCNLKSWPLKQSEEQYGDAVRKWRMCGYEIDSVYDYPIKHFDRIIKHNIPVVLVYGCSDTIVPYDENFGLIDIKGYENMLVIAKKGAGHHPHSVIKCDQIVEFLDR